MSAFSEQDYTCHLSSVSEGEASAAELSITFSHIPVSLVLIATLISAGVAILSGLNPAIKATRTNVLTALRRELRKSRRYAGF
ncbi:hypothetical protein PO124_18400 [Bacillus licheniformis]|nr:hypothetical protein [Bacillus licheniformis]